MRNLARRGRLFLADYVGDARGAAAVALALMVLAGLIEGAGLLLLVPILGLIDGDAPWLLSWLPRDTTARLAMLVGLFALLMLVRAALVHARDMRMARLNTGFVNRLRRSVVDRLAHARWDRLTRLPHGRVTHLAGGDVAASGAAAQGLIQATAGAVMVTIQLAIAFLLSPALAALALALVGLALLSLRPLTRRAARGGEALSGTHIRLSGELLQLLAALKLTRTQGLEAQWVETLARRQEEVGERQLSFVAQRSLAGILFSTSAALIAAGALLFGHAVLALPLAVLLAMLVVLSRLAGPAGQIQQGLQLFAHSLPAYEALKRLGDDLGEPEKVPATGNTLAGPLRLEGVSYLHQRGGEGEARGVRSVTLRLEPGSLVGITGPSGAGKTTLVDLVAGLVAPQSGQILIGGRPLDTHSLGAWRSALAYVGQDAVLLHDSVRRNLLWGARATDEAALGEALRIAGAEEMVARLEAGLETIVGERGARLSGGERQRLALARALLRRPDLLILDEATNAVDEQAEREILARLASLTPRPTILLIAHRSVNLDLCDRLLRLEDGRVLEDAALGPRLAVVTT